MDEFACPATGIQWRYAGCGAEGVLLLHGWACPWWYWTRFTDRLDQRRFTFLIPDLPGFGASEPPPSSWSFESVARRLAVSLMELGVGECVTVGHSMGGSVALHLAAALPRVAQRLVLFSSYPEPPAADVFSPVLESITEEGIPAALAGQLLSAWYPKSLPEERARLADGFSATPEVLRASALSITMGVAREVRENVSVPTLIVLGAQDFTRPASSAQSFVQGRPERLLRIISDTAHMVHWENPGAAADSFADFIGSEAGV